MGIEGGSSNNEVQNQEIQQSNNEQNELNQAEHQRSGEELEGNSTIDNEGERKQIEGKDDATDSSEDESLKLDSDDSIENDPSQEQPTETESVSPEQQQLDNQDTIEGDSSVSDGMSEDNEEITDSLDAEDSIEDEDMSETDSSEDETGDVESLDQDDSIDAGDSTDVDDADEGMQENSIDTDDSIEDEDDALLETETPEDAEDTESDAENPDEGTESENPDDNTESENPDENIETENPESLSNKLDNIKDKAYEGRDSEGNMTPEAKEKLVDDMKQAYDDTPREERGDTLVPEKSEYLKDAPIAENKATGERYDDVNYDWPGNGGFEGKPEEVNPQAGDKFDRLGAENGRYVAPLDGDTPQPVENRGLPYHFTEDNIADEPSYHSYEVDRDFGQLQDAINEYNNPELTAEENDFMRGEFQKEYDRNNWPAEEYTHEPGKTYYGDIAEVFGSGGGTQLELPMSVESLKELGMIHEI